MLRGVGDGLSAQSSELVHASRGLGEQIEELQALRAGERLAHHRDRLEDRVLCALLLHICYSIDYLIRSTTALGDPMYFRQLLPAFVVAQLVGGVVAIGVLRTLYPDITPDEAAEVMMRHEEQTEGGDGARALGGRCRACFIPSHLRGPVPARRRKPAFRAGFRIVGAARFELATF